MFPAPVVLVTINSSGVPPTHIFCIDGVFVVSIGATTVISTISDVMSEHPPFPGNDITT